MRSPLGLPHSVPDHLTSERNEAAKEIPKLITFAAARPLRGPARKPSQIVCLLTFRRPLRKPGFASCGGDRRA